MIWSINRESIIIIIAVAIAYSLAKYRDTEHCSVFTGQHITSAMKPSENDFNTLRGLLYKNKL